jgi:flagellar biosynthetic protein FliQ
MNQALVLDLARQGLTVGLMVTLPVLAVALFTGLAVSVFQAVTQVQEMTLTYLPKMVGAALVFVVMGSWMLNTLVRFTTFCFEQAFHVVR